MRRYIRTLDTKTGEEKFAREYIGQPVNGISRDYIDLLQEHISGFFIISDESEYNNKILEIKEGQIINSYDGEEGVIYKDLDKNYEIYFYRNGKFMSLFNSIKDKNGESTRNPFMIASNVKTRPNFIEINNLLKNAYIGLDPNSNDDNFEQIVNTSIRHMNQDQLKYTDVKPGDTYISISRGGVYFYLGQFGEEDSYADIVGLDGWTFLGDLPDTMYTNLNPSNFTVSTSDGGFLIESSLLYDEDLAEGLVNEVVYFNVYYREKYYDKESESYLPVTEEYDMVSFHATTSEYVEMIESVHGNIYNITLDFLKSYTMYDIKVEPVLELGEDSIYELGQYLSGQEKPVITDIRSIESGARITWDAIETDNLVGYKLYPDYDDNEGFMFEIEGQNTSYTLKNLTPLRNYEARIRAVYKETEVEDGILSDPYSFINYSPEYGFGAGDFYTSDRNGDVNLSFKLGNYSSTELMSATLMYKYHDQDNYTIASIFYGDTVSLIANQNTSGKYGIVWESLEDIFGQYTIDLKLEIRDSKNNIGESPEIRIDLKNIYPNKVNNLHVNNLEKNSFEIEWDKNDLATKGYNVYNYGSLVTNTNDTKLNAICDTHESFNIQVSGVNGLGVGLKSDLLSFQAPNTDPVISIESFNQNFEDEKITINYNLEDADGDLCNVSVEYSDNDGSTWKKASGLFGDISDIDDGSWSVTWKYNDDFTVNTDVLIRLAVNDGFITKYSGQISDIIICKTIPDDIPSATATSITNTSFILQWPEVDFSIDYVIKDNVTGDEIAIIDNNEVELTGLDPHTSYNLDIYARNIIGLSNTPYNINVSTLNNKPVINDISIADGYGDINVIFDLFDEDGDKCDIELNWSDNDGSDWHVGTISDNTEIPTSFNNHIVWNTGSDIASTENEILVRVRANDGIEDGDWIQYPSYVAIMNGPVRAENLISTNVTENSITLSWDDATRTDKYDLYDAETETIIQSDIIYSELPIEVDALTPGTEYKFAVVSKNDSGVMAPPSSVLIKFTLPGTITGLNIIDVTQVTALLEWDVLVGALAYNVYRDSNLIDTVTDNKVPVVNGLLPGENYNIEISGVNDSGEGSTSSIALDMKPPCPTDITTVSLSDTSIEVSWTAAPGATGYDIYVDGDLVINNTNNTTEVITGLEPGTTYLVRVVSL